MPRLLLLTLWTVCALLLPAYQLPNLSPRDVQNKMQEMMQMHASYKQLSPTIIERLMKLYIDEMDYNKVYFLKSEVEDWIEPSPERVQKVLKDVKNSDFTLFVKLTEHLKNAIDRRSKLEATLDMDHLPVANRDDMKDLGWADNEAELKQRLGMLKYLQLTAADKLNSKDERELALQRIQKRRHSFETDFLQADPKFLKRQTHTWLLKAFANSLDAHTAYFTPAEASQFMISVQQKLSGIGVQLRDDLHGFSVVKVIEGGPAWIEKSLKPKDRIIAVNREPVIGMDIHEVVELIRGPANTDVELTLVRPIANSDDQTFNVTLKRRDVVLKETRLEEFEEAFGEGKIGILRLFSFYQDSKNSSAQDMLNALEKMKQDGRLKAVLLDLRYNSGGLLPQAVDVAGLFIKKGVVVSIKDSDGNVQHLRNLGATPAWNGPLFILISRASASAAEIVAQSLQDYGRALVVGDDHTFGKGSFQTFTLETGRASKVNPQGEFKVTRGRYYTVSGKTPQLVGVSSDIEVPSPLLYSDIGERFAKYPLKEDEIAPSFEDNLSDIPFLQREAMRKLYRYNLQPKEDLYAQYLPVLESNSQARQKNNKPYQEFLKQFKDEKDEGAAPSAWSMLDDWGVTSDFQLTESLNIIKDLLTLTQNEPIIADKNVATSK